MTLVSEANKLMLSACIRNITFVTVLGTIGAYISQNQERRDGFLVVGTKKSSALGELCQ